MGVIFANPLEELVEFQELNRDLEQGKGFTGQRVCGFPEGSSDQ